MITPNIRYYARMEDCTGNGKTPKYRITAQAGYFPTDGNHNRERRQSINVPASKQRQW